jgi:predicted CoA-binding protein
MPSEHETFWTKSSYAVVGHSSARAFPKLSYGALKKQGRQAFAVDPSVAKIGDDPTWPDLASLPQPVDAVVLEVPKDECAEWIRRAADAGIHEVWIHQKCDTPEALAVAREHGIHVLTGTCAVMYLERGFSFHSLHKWIAKAIGKY